MIERPDESTRSQHTLEAGLAQEKLPAMAKLPQDYRLTCNRIFRHLVVYSQQNFTGKLHVPAPNGNGWDIYMTWGKLTWATGGRHPKRRWRRQHYLTTGTTPDFRNIDTTESPCWDYLELSRLSMGTFGASQVSKIICGTLQEILFDLVQCFEQPLEAFITPQEPLSRIAVLSGIGDGMQVQPSEGVLPSERHRFPPTWMMPVMDLQKETQNAWEEWVGMGLFGITLDEAPVIQNHDKLRAKTSPRVYQNMSALLNGARSFRDIALKIKSSKDQFGAGRALANYIRRGYVTTKAVNDIANSTTPRTPATTIQRRHPAHRSLPVVVCMDASGKQQEMFEHLASQAGFAYEGLTHAYEALYKLSQDWFPKPSVIFLSDRLPLLPHCEACRLLQRVERLRQVPIIVYSEAGQDKRARLEAEKAGATEYLGGDEFSRKRILSRLYTYSGRSTATSAHGAMSTLDVARRLTVV